MHQKGKAKISSRDLRRFAARKDIMSLRELASRLQCSTTSLYFALEKPSRFGPLWVRISNLLEIPNPNHQTHNEHVRVLTTPENAQ